MYSVGSLLGFFGAVVFLGSIIWLHFRAFKDGAFPDTLLLLTGISLVAYVVTSWKRAKIPTLLALCGLVAMVGGPSLGVALEDQRSARAFKQGAEAMKRKDFDHAIICFSEAIRLNRNIPEAYYNRGVAYGTKGDLDKALPDFVEAIHLAPKFAEAYYWRGTVYESKGEKDKAEEDFAQAAKFGYDPK